MIITKKDGTVLNVSEFNTKVLKYHIPSPSLIHTSESIEGRDGDIFIDSHYQNRIISVEAFYESADLTDYYLLKSELYRLFARKEPFYVSFRREPGKRWYVRLNTPFEPKRASMFAGSFELEFIADSPFAESVGTTLNPFTFDAELWQFGQGVVPEDLVYTHSTNLFSIYNGSDIAIDPRQLPLKIEFIGASDNLTIRNLTSGDEWRHTGSSVAGDVIVLDGIRSMKNNVSIFGQTNKKLVSLHSGWNDFEIVGPIGSFSISFDFRFYTL